MSEVQLDRSGLPVRQEAGSPILTPGGFAHDYRAWLRDTGRGSEDIPAGTRRFVDWWSPKRDEPGPQTGGPDRDGPRHPDRVVAHLASVRPARTRLVPFDLKRFSEWWRTQAIRDRT